MGSELFGSDIHKNVTDRADTINAFNKAVSKVESTTKQLAAIREKSFLYRRLAAYGSRSGGKYADPIPTEEDSKDRISGATKENIHPETNRSTDLSQWGQ